MTGQGSVFKHLWCCVSTSTATVNIGHGTECHKTDVVQVNWARCSCMQMRKEFEAEQAALKADLASVRAELANQAKARDQHAASNKALMADNSGLQAKLAAAQAHVEALAGGGCCSELVCCTRLNICRGLSCLPYVWQVVASLHHFVLEPTKTAKVVTLHAVTVS